jgi:hypothetical protein
MSTLAAIRPDSWNVPLFLHVLGAMLLVGATFTSASLLGFAGGRPALLRVGYWTLLAVGLPSYVLMRMTAYWVADKEGYDTNPEPDWIGVGYAVVDLGGLLFLIALVSGGIGTYRLRGGKGTGLLKTTMVLSVVLLAAYTIAIWAMSAKPD